MRLCETCTAHSGRNRFCASCRSTYRAAQHAAFVGRALDRARLGNRPRIEAAEDVSPAYSGTPAAQEAPTTWPLETEAQPL